MGLLDAALGEKEILQSLPFLLFLAMPVGFLCGILSEE